MRLSKVLAIAIGVALSACSNQASSVLPDSHRLNDALATKNVASTKTNEIFGSFTLHFRNGKVSQASGVAISRKQGTEGEWLSIRGEGFDWQVRTKLIQSIEAASDTSNSTKRDMELTSVPIRTRQFSVSPDYIQCPQLSEHPGLSGGGCCVESCGADGTAWGECGAGSCGSNGPEITDGTGVGTNYPGNGNLGCSLNFSDGTLDCFDGNGTDLNSPADLFLQFKLTAADAYLTCANPVNPGYADATYADPNQRGGATKIIPAGPGSNTWDFPSDFGPFRFGYVYPPVQPVKFGATYYKWGVVGRWRSQAQGFCKYPHA